MKRDKAERTYAVGRGKPPTDTRFKPGQSRNPKGRPRGSVGFAQALIKAASEMVDITENGRQMRLSKTEIAARQVANKAASGDQGSIEPLVKVGVSLAQAELAAASPADPANVSVGNEDDMRVLEAFMERMKKEGSP